MERKKPPHTEYEKQLLLQLLQPHVSVLDCRRTDGVTLKKKQEAWENLTADFNSSSNITNPVTSKQLKKMWLNLKSKARDAKTLAKQANRTGGGPQPPDIGPLESQVLAVMPNVMPTIDVDIDSDIMYVEDQESGADSDSDAWLLKKNRAQAAQVTEVEIYPPQLSNTRDSTQPSTSHDFNTPQQSISSDIKCPPQPSTSRHFIPPKPAPANIRKRRERGEAEKDSIDVLKRKIYLREFKYMEERFELEKKMLLEKHNKEMEILEIKKQIALQELNK